MLARPLASETVTARAVCRLKCSVVAKATAGARRSPNARAAAASPAATWGWWRDERGAGTSELWQRTGSSMAPDRRREGGRADQTRGNRARPQPRSNHDWGVGLGIPRSESGPAAEDWHP